MRSTKQGGVEMVLGSMFHEVCVGFPQMGPPKLMVLKGMRAGSNHVCEIYRLARSLIQCLAGYD